MKDITDIDDPRLVKAFAHPLRIRILGIFENQTASPSEIADQLGVPLGNVSYHVRILADYGLIKLVRRTPRRGAIEHHYEAVGRLRITDGAWNQAPEVVKDALLRSSLGQVSSFVNAAAVAGGFDRDDAQLSRSPMVLDERGFKALAKEVQKLYDKARTIEQESTKRLKGANSGPEVNSGLVMMLFEGQDFEASTAAPKRKPAARKRGGSSGGFKAGSRVE
jgi:DNA-binding transcriptional ArsR family regulator